MGKRQMSQKFPHASAEAGGPARILYVDPDPVRSMQVREAIEIAGFGEPETATSGDEALDVLGSRAQQFDVVAAWMPLPDSEAVDLPGVLRRCRSPVRLVALTTLTARTYPLAGRLAGIAGVSGDRGERNIVQCLRTVLASDHTVANIVARHVGPETLPEVWTMRVYGHQPGARFSAKLD